MSKHRFFAAVLSAMAVFLPLRSGAKATLRSRAKVTLFEIKNKKRHPLKEGSAQLFVSEDGSRCRLQIKIDDKNKEIACVMTTFPSPQEREWKMKTAQNPQDMLIEYDLVVGLTKGGVIDLVSSLQKVPVMDPGGLQNPEYGIFQFDRVNFSRIKGDTFLNVPVPQMGKTFKVAFKFEDFEAL